MKQTRILKEKMHEIYAVRPNELGFHKVTMMYKAVVPYFKTMPFIIVIPVAFCVAMFMYVVLGPFLVKLVTLFQHGF